MTESVKYYVEGDAVVAGTHRYYGGGIEIEKGIKAIAEKAFYRNIGLGFAILPDGLKRIGKSAFEGCRELKFVYIPKSVEVIEEDAFKDCPDLVIYLQGRSKKGWVNKTEVRIVEDRIVTPEDDAFNFHRSSGGWSYTTVEREVEVKVCWNPDNRPVKCNVSDASIIRGK